MEYIDWLFPISDTLIHEENDSDVPVKLKLCVWGGEEGRGKNAFIIKMSN